MFRRKVTAPGGLDDLGIFGAIIIVILSIFLVVFLALVLFNVVAIALELLIVVILLVAGVIGRVVFRKPWTLFAKSGAQVHYTAVVGWRASRRSINEMARWLESGGRIEAPPRDRR